MVLKMQPGFGVMENNSLSRLIAGISLGAGIALYCAYRAHRRNQSLAGRARRQADSLMKNVDDLRESAAELVEKSRKEATRQAKGIQEAVNAGTRAYRSATS
jgi:hypothetical protein